MNTSESTRLALSLDDVEADLVRMQAAIYRVRQVLERVAGRPVGYQYEQPNERSAVQALPEVRR